MSAAVAVIQFLLDLGDGTELDYLRHCEDEGCPFYNTGATCRPKEKGCVVTVAEPDALAKLCAEMVTLHSERGSVLTIHMDEMKRLTETKANFIFMSGDKDALRVTPNDRRFAVVWPLAQEEAARKQFEALARDSYGFKRSRKGTYVNATTARDWKWFRLGMRAS